MPLKAHGNAWLAVTDLVRSGYPVEEALAAGTSGAADACGVGSETGRLAAGYDADLLVVDGDLRSDPDALGRPQAVLVTGAPGLTRSGAVLPKPEVLGEGDVQGIGTDHWRISDDSVDLAGPDSGR